MLSSNGMQTTIEYFLRLVKAQSPEISLLIFMTDCNHAQENAICAAFPECQCVFYCWWHVLRAIYTSVATARLKDRLAVEPDRFLAELSRPTANGSLAPKSAHERLQAVQGSLSRG